MNGLLAGLPNAHPPAVHFPLVLLPISVALDLLGVVRARRHLDVAARWALWLGTLGAAVAVYTGHEAADVLRPGVGIDAGGVMTTHHDVAMAALVAAAVLSLWRLVLPDPGTRRWRAVYLAIALGLLGALAVTADLGGRLVFVHGVAVRGAT